MVLLQLAQVVPQLLLFQVLLALERCLHHLVVFLCLLLNLLILVYACLTLHPPLQSDLLADLEGLLLLVPVYLLDPLPAEGLRELHPRTRRDQPLLPVLPLQRLQVSTLLLQGRQ